MGTISDKVLNKIREEKITPAPKWKFLLKDSIVWIAFLGSVLVGGLAFCVVLTVAIDNDWDIYRQAGHGFFEYILLSLPYFWILLLVAFVGIAFYNFKHTKNGYRCRTFLIFASSIAGSAALGLAFHYYFGLGEKIDGAFFRSVPLYENIGCQCCRKKALWSQPQKGLLGGKIQELESVDKFLLEDFSGGPWRVEGENVVWRGNLVPQTGILIKIIGNKEDEYFFRAREIRPWMSMGD
jgi:hypothetical protein